MARRDEADPTEGPTAEARSVDMTQDGPMVDGWEVWRVEDGGEVFWLLRRPSEPLDLVLRAANVWDLSASDVDDYCVEARRWTMHESLHTSVGVEDHPRIRVPLREAAEQQARIATRHDPSRVIASTCW